MELRFLRTFVLFGNSSLDELTSSLFYEDEDKLILVKYNMEGLAPLLLEEMKSYLSLEKITEEKMFEYLFKHLHDLPMYRANLLLPLMSDYKILRQVFRHLRDFYPILADNKKSTEYLYPWFQMIVDRVTQFCFDLWTGKYKEDFGNEYYYDDYNVSQCSYKITSLLIDIIPLELEVLNISTLKLMK
ncbi:hypothetical protein KY290_020426 [Solanum tuberosum]|uniref:Uncharacterized protein n=1 Tax=Solanum tuberosum TaxID=4113 RepID=A0ABQ7UYM3_SOLTU|nr:hypothetical protein KY290_020426 [Solanum tuberosum]